MKQRDNETALVQRRKNQALLVLHNIDGERAGFLTDLGRVVSRKIIKQAGCPTVVL